MKREERRRYLSHLRDCRECRQEAARKDPTIVFSLLPTEEVTDEEIREVRQTVQAMRRMRTLESVARSKHPSRLVVGAIAAMLLIAVLLIPQRRLPGESEEVPFAGAVGVGSGLVEMPAALSSTPSGILQVELRRGAKIEPGPTRSVLNRLWEAEIPIEGKGRVVRHLQGGYRLHFDLGDGVASDILELRDFELLRIGEQGSVALLAADLQPELNRPMIVGLPSEGTGADVWWLELTWSKGTVAAR